MTILKYQMDGRHNLQYVQRLSRIPLSRIPKVLPWLRLMAVNLILNSLLFVLFSIWPPGVNYYL